MGILSRGYHRLGLLDGLTSHTVMEHGSAFATFYLEIGGWSWTKNYSFSPHIPCGSPPSSLNPFGHRVPDTDFLPFRWIIHGSGTQFSQIFGNGQITYHCSRGGHGITHGHSKRPDPSFRALN